MATDAPRNVDGVRKKKKKKRPSSASSRTSTSTPKPVLAVPVPPPARDPRLTFAAACVAFAAAGALLYKVVTNNKPSDTISAASASGAESGDPTKTPSDVAAPPADAQKTASGLAYRVLRPGDGKNTPVPSDQVKVHYAGWSADGKLFDSSYTRNQPATFGVTQVIKGWTEGLQLMTVGEKARFWIPAALAYGEHPGGGKPGGQLTFDVELLEIVK